MKHAGCVSWSSACAWERESWMFSNIRCFWRSFAAPDIRNRSDPGPAVNSSVVTGWVVHIWCGWTLILGLAASVLVAVVFERFCGVVLSPPAFCVLLVISLAVCFCFFFQHFTVNYYGMLAALLQLLKMILEKIIFIASINHKHVGCITI